jgi:hypothetical protein
MELKYRTEMFKRVDVLPGILGIGPQMCRYVDIDGVVAERARAARVL